MIFDRQEFAEELRLRETIRRAIKITKNRNIVREKEENKLRSLIRGIIKEQEEDLGGSNRSTGINELETLLKKIVPQIEDDYKTLTTDEEQRKSFRAHILHAVQNILATVLPDGLPGGEEENLSLDESMLLGMLEEEIDVTIDDDAFIPVREKDLEEEEPEEEPTEEDQDLAGFRVAGEDQTGGNIAHRSWKKIEQAITDSYALLDNPSDKEEFYDYLITNLKLYFDKFEDELAGDELEEPTTPEYEQEKQDLEAGGEEEGLEDLGFGGEEELEL
jgi:hypothetical protein